MPSIYSTVPTACITWKTGKPVRGVSPKSGDFSILGAVWWLEAKLSPNNKNEMCYTVTLKKKSGQVSSVKTCNITTVLELNISTAGSIAYYKYRFQVQEVSQTTVWRYTEQFLTEKYGNFLTYEGAWKIMCIFQDISPPELKLGSREVDSSAAPVDAEASTTAAEKSTQVSRDFSDMEKLSDDFSNLRRLSLYPDARLRCGDRTVPVHRSVLATRSRKFDAMFRNPSSDTFDVTDLDDKTLDLLLEYAYSGTVRELSDDTAAALYGAGHKYGMDSLSRACSDWMILHLTPENCVGFLDAASSSGGAALEEAVASFLCDHPDVFESPSWDRFAEQQPKLAHKLIHMYAFRGKVHSSVAIQTCLKVRIGLD